MTRSCHNALMLATLGPLLILPGVNRLWRRR